MADAHRTQEPQLPELGDAALERTISQLLAKHPDRRPEDTRQVEEALSLSSPSTGQLALQQLAALHSKRELQQEAHKARVAREDEMRAGARESLARIWDDLTHLARAADPGVRAFDQGADEWFLQALFGRLAVQILQPSDRSSALWIGTVSVRFLDADAVSFIANVRCVSEGEGHRWSILRFTRNDLSTQRVSLGPQFQDGPSGLGLGAFDALDTEIGQAGIPVVITTSKSSARGGPTPPCSPRRCGPLRPNEGTQIVLTA